MSPLKEYLNLALQALFRSTSSKGFWDESGYIVRALRCNFDKNGRPTWIVDRRLLYRYRGFVLMGLSDWRESSLGTSTFDQQLESFLTWQAEIIASRSMKRIPSYGVGSLLYAFGSFLERFPFESMVDVLIKEACTRFPVRHPEDALLIMGLCKNWDRLDLAQRRMISAAVDNIRSLQNFNGLIVMPHLAQLSRYHQNQMYLCWGLGAYGLRERRETVKQAISRVVEFTVTERMQSDGGILWHEGGDWVHRAANLYRKSLRRKILDVEKLFECHQTFFVNTVDLLGRLGETKYADAADRALNWIWGGNCLGRDLTRLTCIGVPWRVISIDGQWRIMGETFKGVYEIGSYLRALSAPERRTVGNLTPEALIPLETGSNFPRGGSDFAL